MSVKELKLRYEDLGYKEEREMEMPKRSTATTLALPPGQRGGWSGAASRVRKQSDRAHTLFYCYTYA